MNESFPHAVLRLMGEVPYDDILFSGTWHCVFLAASAAAYYSNQGPFRVAVAGMAEEELLRSLHEDTEALLYRDNTLTVWCTPSVLVVNRRNHLETLTTGFTLVGLVGRTIPKDHEALINFMMKDVLNAP